MVSYGKNGVDGDVRDRVKPVEEVAYRDLAVSSIKLAECALGSVLLNMLEVLQACTLQESVLKSRQQVGVADQGVNASAIAEWLNVGHAVRTKQVSDVELGQG